MIKAISALTLFTILLSSCGYTMRGQERPFFQEKKIRTVFIPPVKNDSYKAGIEIIVYNLIRKRFAQWGYVRIVDSEAQADATFGAVVQMASLDPQGVIYGPQIAGFVNGNKAPATVAVAPEYNVTIRVRFELRDSHKKVLWSNSIDRAKVFQSATFYGNLGSTSALINESQFDDVLEELASSVISDAEESMNAVF